MKKFEYILAGLLIFIGLGCLTASISLTTGDSWEMYVKHFFELCLFMGIPILIIGIIYFFIIAKRK
ncbi:hypothetical protein ERJ70_06915 [Sediminibacillus dalangtanensis]|uniref:Lipoprotein n=1 Tax=Sediminibacillus dalangtanensis TaxID=2729421 RepID=A0ABX7VSS0_9BACI|nr:hypothetical protein [Sediminibacillus dalangtanensis]QTM99054.1 hypothetical protein ERJ70_06915 [Sediminibacillus dalangtanensis]